MKPYYWSTIATVKRFLSVGQSFLEIVWWAEVFLDRQWTPWVHQTTVANAYMPRAAAPWERQADMEDIWVDIFNFIEAGSIHHVMRSFSAKNV